MALRRILILVVAGAVLLAGGLAILWRPRPASRIYALVAEAPGVRVGTVVTYRGISIGRVAETAFADSGVRLAIDLERPDVPLRAGDSLWLRTKGIRGDKVIDISPGPRDSPRLHEGGELRAMRPLLNLDRQTLRTPRAEDSARRDGTEESGSRP